jgi:hypothetical protein
MKNFLPLFLNEKSILSEGPFSAEKHAAPLMVNAIKNAVARLQSFVSFLIE